MKINIKKTVMLAVTILLLYFIFANLNFTEFFNNLKGVDGKYLILLVFSIVISLFFRGLCFKQLIYKTVNIPAIEAGFLCITSAALNICLPARAGDMFRAYYTGDKYKADKIKIFGAVMFERVLDMVIICSLLLFGICIYNKNELAMKLCLIAFLLLILSVVFTVLTYKFNQIDKVCNLIKKVLNKLHCPEIAEKIITFINKISASFCSGFEIIDSPKRTVLAVFTSAAIWFFECVSYYLTLLAFHCPAHWSITIFIVCFIVFACLIPSASIFIGPYQVAVITAFAMYGLSKETALAISVMDQFVVVLTTITIAVLFLLKNNISIAKFKEDIKKD